MKKYIFPLDIKKGRSGFYIKMTYGMQINYKYKVHWGSTKSELTYNIGDIFYSHFFKSKNDEHCKNLKLIDYYYVDFQFIDRLKKDLNCYKVLSSTLDISAQSVNVEFKPIVFLDNSKKQDYIFATGIINFLTRKVEIESLSQYHIFPVSFFN